MAHRTYKPKRANKRWTEGAPDYILDVFRVRGTNNCTYYDVLLGDRFFDPALIAHRKVHALDVSHMDDSTMINYTWTEWNASFRPAHRRVKWGDIPETVRKCITLVIDAVRD